MIASFWIGFRTFFNGFHLLTRYRRLRWYILIPLILSMAVFFTALYIGVQFIPGAAAAVLAFMLPTFLMNILYLPFMLLVWVAFILLSALMAFLLSGVIAAPFNSLLAEKTLEYLEVLPHRQRSIWEWLQNTVGLLLVSLVKAIILGCLGLVLFILSLIPIVNIPASFGLVILMAFDCMDCSFEALELGLGARLGFFKKNFWFILGLSSALGLTLLVPGLNLLVMPFTVVSGAGLIREIQFAARPDTSKNLPK